MVVSDRAKKYAIAAALFDANSWHSMMRQITVPAATALTGGAAVHLLCNHKGTSQMKSKQICIHI